MGMIKSFDGVGLNVDELGAGQPLVLVHGFLSNARVNWQDYGTAQTLADAGFRVIMPDLRGHGRSEAPTDGAAYPPGVLARDLAHLIAALELHDYHLVGYSLGARTAARVVADGARPAKLILSGMGYEGLTHIAPRRDWFIETIQNRDQPPAGAGQARVIRFLASMKVSPEAAIGVMQSQVDVTPAELAAIRAPTLVLCGADDADNGSAQKLAAAIPTAHYQEIPGDHMSTITKPDFGAAIRDFLASS
jgi:pimeloyl-ACP methyl ester carboxylesterase